MLCVVGAVKDFIQRHIKTDGPVADQLRFRMVRLNQNHLKWIFELERGNAVLVEIVLGVFWIAAGGRFGMMVPGGVGFMCVLDMKYFRDVVDFLGVEMPAVLVRIHFEVVGMDVLGMVMQPEPNPEIQQPQRRQREWHYFPDCAHKPHEYVPKPNKGL